MVDIPIGSITQGPEASGKFRLGADASGNARLFPIKGLVFSCGYLRNSGTSAIVFEPRNGDKVRVNGADYQIPSGGISAGFTGIRVNGAAGQNLAANTTYLVCLFDNAGTLTVDYRTTLTHAPSTADGSEVSSADATRAVIGMVRTNASAQLTDVLSVISWFNRRRKNGVLNVGNQSTTSLSQVALGPAVGWLTWAEEVVEVHLYLQASRDASFGGYGIYIDTVSNTFAGVFMQYASSTAAGDNDGSAMSGVGTTSEGWHTFGVQGAMNAAGTLSIFNPFLHYVIMG